MPGNSAASGSRRAPRADGRVRGAGDSSRLLRYSHIFASAVNEVLESKLLRDASPLPLTVSQFHILKLMALNGQHQVGEVAGFLGVSAPAATKNVDKLERLGLLVRTRSEGDRRASLLSVSPKGRRVVAKHEELKLVRLAPVLEKFQPAEIEQLSQLLERFAVSLLESEPPRNGFCLRCAAYIEPGCPVGELRGGCPYQKRRGSRLRADAAKETP